MHVVAVVAENPSLAQSSLTAGLAEQAHQTSPLPVTLVDLHSSEAPAAPVPPFAPHLRCHTVGELSATLAQLRYAGAEWVFVDCQLAFDPVADGLLALVDLVIVATVADRRRIEAVSSIVGAAQRRGKAVVFALTNAEPGRKTTAAHALALARFAPVVPMAVATMSPADLDSGPRCAADETNAELLRAVRRSLTGEDPPPTAFDWTATLWRSDGDTEPCRLVAAEADAWRIAAAAAPAVGEVIRLTVPMLGRFDATVVGGDDSGVIAAPFADANRQLRLAGKLASRISARIAAPAPQPTASAAPASTAPAAVEPAFSAADAGPAEAATAKRRAHPLIERVATVPTAQARLQELNRSLAGQGRPPQRTPGRIIVVGNEKGGTGKSTLTIHLVVALLKEGFDVATIDLDCRQGSLSRYLDNRRAFAASNGTALLHPFCHTVTDSHDDELRFSNLLMEQSHNRDFVVLDTPGHDQPLSRLAHLFADTVITPINDSFLDLDVIARLDPETADYVGPSHYGRVILQARAERGSGGGLPDWIVVRNRLSTVLARNKVDMAAAVDRLSQQMGFRVGPGLTERVIYRELFLYGLTLLDLRDQGVGVAMNMSHVAARQELRSLLQTLLPGLTTPAPTAAKPAQRVPLAERATTIDREIASTQIDAVFADAARTIEHVNAG